MKKNVIVREYTDDDFESLTSLYKDPSTIGGSYDGARDTREKLLSTADDLCLFVASSEDAVVGSVMILDNPHSFWLVKFCVSQSIDEQSQKEVSKLLLGIAEKIAKTRSHENIIVYTEGSDEAVTSMYKQLDFLSGGSNEHFWKPVQADEKGVANEV